MPGLVAKLGLIRLQSSELFLNFGYLMIEFQIFNYLDELNANQIGTCWWTKCVFARSHTHTHNESTEKKPWPVNANAMIPTNRVFFSCVLPFEYGNNIVHNTQNKQNSIVNSLSTRSQNPTRNIWNEKNSKNSIYIFL